MDYNQSQNRRVEQTIFQKSKKTATAGMCAKLYSAHQPRTARRNVLAGTGADRGDPNDSYKTIAANLKDFMYKRRNTSNNFGVMEQHQRTPGRTRAAKDSENKVSKWKLNLARAARRTTTWRKSPNHQKI